MRFNSFCYDNIDCTNVVCCTYDLRTWFDAMMGQVIGFFWLYSMQMENYPYIDPIRRLIISFKFNNFNNFGKNYSLVKNIFSSNFKRYKIYLIWKIKGKFFLILPRELIFSNFKWLILIILLLKLSSGTKKNILENNTLFESNLPLFSFS